MVNNDTLMWSKNRLQNKISETLTLVYRINQAFMFNERGRERTEQILRSGGFQSWMRPPERADTEDAPFSGCQTKKASG